MKKLLAICLCSLSWLSGAVDIDFEDVTEKSVSDNTIVVSSPLNTPLTLVITIKRKSSDLQNITIPGLEAFQIVGRSQSTRIGFINGQQTASTNYKYSLRARQEGTFTLGPVALDLGGQTVTSQAATVTITSPTAQNQSATTVRTQEQKTAHVSIELVADKEKAFVDEPITVKRRIIVDAPIIDYGQTPLVAPDFSITELENESKYHENRDGKSVTIFEKTYLLTPLTAGEKQIEPLRAKVVVQTTPEHSGGFDVFNQAFLANFFGPQGRSVDLMSNPLKIIIKSIPRHAAHADAVGIFESITLDLEKTHISVGEPTTLKLTLEGNGQMERVSTPNLTLPPGFKSYQSKSSVEKSKKTFEYIIQATQPGTHVIPAQTFSFFNPATERLHEIKTEPRSINVEGSSQPLTPNKPLAPEQAQESLKQNITTQKEKSQSPLHWAIMLIITLSSGILLFWQHIKTTVITLQQRLCAPSTSTKATIKQIKKSITAQDVRALHKLYIRLIAKKTGLNESVVTESSIEQYLKVVGWEQSKIDDFLTFIASCAQMHFSHISHNGDSEKILHKATYWLLMLTDQKS